LDFLSIATINLLPVKEPTNERSTDPEEYSYEQTKKDNDGSLRGTSGAWCHRFFDNRDYRLPTLKIKACLGELTLKLTVELLFETNLPLEAITPKLE
jgi:hypothetical protein